MDFEKVCDEIFKIDPKVRYAAVFDYFATKVAGGMRKGVKSILPESLTKLSVDQAIIRWRSRLALEDWIGLPKYAIAEYDKIKRCIIYLNSEHLLLISTEVEMDGAKLINNVNKILKRTV